MEDNTSKHLVVETKNSRGLDMMGVIHYLFESKYVYSGNKYYHFDQSEKIYKKISKEEIENVIFKIATDEQIFIPQSTVDNIIRQFRASASPQETIRRLKREKEKKGSTYSEDEKKVLFESKDVIPFRNCLFSLDHDVLIPTTPDYFSNFYINANYYPNGLPTHEKYNHENVEVAKWALNKILPNDDDKKLFFEMVGYTFFSENMNPPTIFVIIGSGETGKTALQNMVYHFAQQAISVLSLDQITSEFLTGGLEGVRCNISGESGEGQNNQFKRVDGETLKRLSDGQKLTVNVKNRDPRDFYNKAKLWFISNTWPEFNDPSSGMLRRIVALPCKFKQKKEDNLWSKLETPEAMDYLAYESMKAYKEFLDRGKQFTMSLSVEDEIMIFALQDGLREFLMYYFGTIDPNVLHKELHEYHINDIYREYIDYTYSSGGKPLSKKKLSSRITTEYRMYVEYVRGTQENGRPTNVGVFMARD